MPRRRRARWTPARAPLLPHTGSRRSGAMPFARPTSDIMPCAAKSGLRRRPICARRCKKRTAPQRRGRLTRAHTDHYHGTPPRPHTYPRLGAVFRPWVMSGARQGHGPCLACPSGDTENGVSARAATWPSAKLSIRDPEGVGRRNEPIC